MASRLLCPGREARVAAALYLDARVRLYADACPMDVPCICCLCSHYVAHTSRAQRGRVEHARPNASTRGWLNTIRRRGRGR
eukprot:6422949-Pyramimonas_sp.AAC.1